MMKATEQAYNNNTLKNFNTLMYKDVLDEEHIIGDEMCIRINEEQSVDGFVLKKERKRYFIQTEHINKLPVKIINEQKIVFSGNPKAVEGENLITGKQIIFFLKEDRAVIEGSKLILQNSEGLNKDLK